MPTTSTPSTTRPQPTTTAEKLAPSISNPMNNKALFNALSVKIHALRSHHLALTQMHKMYSCYSKGCLAAKPAECYSPLCRKRERLRIELLNLLHKASALNQANKENTKVITLATNAKKIIKTEGNYDLFSQQLF